MGTPAMHKSMQAISVMRVFIIRAGQEAMHTESRFVADSSRNVNRQRSHDFFTEHNPQRYIAKKTNKKQM